MGLSSLQLDAFYAAARLKSFSAAARSLAITQGALTQRIKALETELGTRLFVRLPRGVELTPAAARLLRYCQTRDQLEQETVSALRGKAPAGGLGGEVRIAAYSSVLRSVVLPALGPLLREHPAVRLNVRVAEMRELPQLLLSGQVDLAVIDHHVHHVDLESIEIGTEANVVVESSEYACPHDVYLDHDPDDPTTAVFLRAQPTPPPPFRRSYCDEIYLLMDAVALGLGRGVVPRHLAERDDRLRVAPGFVPQRVPVVLHALRETLLGGAAKLAAAALRRAAPELLRLPSELSASRPATRGAPAGERPPPRRRARPKGRGG